MGEKLSKILMIFSVMILTLGVGVVHGDEVEDDNGSRAIKYTGDPEKVSTPTYVNGILLVNKQNPLPHTYKPSNTTRGDYSGEQNAFNALDKMFEEAKKDGVNLKIVSAYRSYERQKELYDEYVQNKGKELADTFSARPGYSEHQTGLTFDVLGGSTTQLTEEFGDTTEGKWIANNAYKYGFIVRYPKGKDYITGYQYEPWHLRHIGVTEAQKMKESGKSTLEEYLDVVGKSGSVIDKDKESGTGSGSDINKPGVGEFGGSEREKFDPFRTHKTNTSSVGLDSSNTTLPGEASYIFMVKSEQIYKFFRTVMFLISAVLVVFISLQMVSLVIAVRGDGQQGEKARKVESFLFGGDGYGATTMEHSKIIITNIFLLMIILTLVLGSYYVGIQGRIYAAIAYILEFLF